MSKSTSGQYTFRKADSIGANDAENDERFLSRCFEDTGDLSALISLKHPERVVVGRTGSGKSALLIQLAKETKNVIAIEPESLSLNYITNSTIIRFLSELGIKLDPFYKLLWRHVFAITLLQRELDLHDAETARASFLSCIFEGSAKRKHRQKEQERYKKAMNYLEQWGGSFWKDIDVRIQEITSTFEQKIRDRIDADHTAGVSANLGPIKLALSDSAGDAVERMNCLTSEQKANVIQRAQQVVNEIQVQELTGMLEFLDEVLAGSSQDYYIAIDRLDDGWVENTLRYRLIKALLDTVREFGKVHKAKVIIALRLDLIEQVFKETRGDQGFQEEKYRSLYLPLRWSREQLISLLNRRIAALIKDQYTNYTPTIDNVLPRWPSTKTTPIDYILERTWMRPRDVIDFFNICIKRAEGKAQFTRDIISNAEGEYSQGRFRSIMEEWHELYPNLETVATGLLRKRPERFCLSQISDNELDEVCFNVVEKQNSNDPISESAEMRVHGTTTAQLTRAAIAFILYRTGIVGIRMGISSTPKWAANESYEISQSEITDDDTLYPHRGLWRVLGIVPS